mgnify:CR=1 FL=1
MFGLNHAIIRMLINYCLLKADVMDLVEEGSKKKLRLVTHSIEKGSTEENELDELVEALTDFGNELEKTNSELKNIGMEDLELIELKNKRSMRLINYYLNEIHHNL